MRSQLLRGGRILLGLTILFFLIKRLHNLLAAFEVEAIAFQPFWLIISLTLLILYWVALCLPWFFFYRAGSVNPIPFLSGWTFFQLSQFGRYLPGKVGQFVWMLSLARRFGIEKKRALLATCFQLTCQCGLGCLIGFLILRNTEVAPLLYDLLTDFQIPGKMGILIGSIGTIMLGTGTIFFYRQRIIAAVSHLVKQDFHVPFLISGTLRFISGYLLLWGLLGSAFFLFINSIYPVDFSQLIMVTGIYAVAWSIGFLSFLTPSGLGVREGILSLLLTTVLPPATAILVALLSRLWTLGTELSLGGLAFGIYFRQRRVQQNLKAYQNR